MAIVFAISRTIAPSRPNAFVDLCATRRRLQPFVIRRSATIFPSKLSWAVYATIPSAPSRCVRDGAKRIGNRDMAHVSTAIVSSRVVAIVCITADSTVRLASPSSSCILSSHIPWLASSSKLSTKSICAYRQRTPSVRQQQLALFGILLSRSSTIRPAVSAVARSPSTTSSAAPTYFSCSAPSANLTIA